MMINLSHGGAPSPLLGVDSMVLSKICALLQQAAQQQSERSNSSYSSNPSQLTIREIVAIHIDYANRPESSREADYVRSWCDSLGITCKVRVVSEVTRGITDRDAYEKISREIRYSFYQQCLDEVRARHAAGVAVSGVIFGHHQGDVQENVISNVMRFVHYLFHTLYLSSND